MLVENLVKIGLTEKEAKMYLALLELGEASVQDISKKSGIRRTTVYDILESLKQKGFIGLSVQKKRKLYFAQNPKKLEVDLEEKKKIVSNIMPDLLAVTNLLDKKPGVKYFQGEFAFKDVYKDILEYPEREICAWFSELYKEIDDDFFEKYFVPTKIKKKIWTRAIYPDNKVMRQAAKTNQESLRKTKFVTSKEFEMPIAIILYAESKIGITSFKEGISMIIESKIIYMALKSIFELQWNSLPG